METNRTILLRAVVSIEDRKTVGAVKGHYIDYDDRAISHYVVGTDSLQGLSLLPQEKVLTVGDTYVTIRTASDLLTAEDEGAKEILTEKPHLVGLEVFSQDGSRLGFVEGFSFDTATGKVLDFTMSNGEIFPSESFLFFSPEYVFVDLAVAESLKPEPEPEPEPEFEEVVEDEPEFETIPLPELELELEPVFEEVVEDEPEIEEVVEDEPEIEEVVEDEPEIEDEEVFEPAVEEIVAPEPELELEPEPEVSLDADDADLKELLIGAILNTDVASEDGAFKAAKGTEITQAIYDEAEAHDAVLLLTISIDL